MLAQIEWLRGLFDSVPIPLAYATVELYESRSQRHCPPIHLTVQVIFMESPLGPVFYLTSLWDFMTAHRLIQPDKRKPVLIPEDLVIATHGAGNVIVQA